jgi:hypothetical protein
MFDPIFANKSKKNLKQFNKTEYRPKPFSQHGLLIDKYLDNNTIDEDSMNDSFLSKYFIHFVFIIFFVCLVYYYRDTLFKSFRERHKRSVLKYSV